MKNQIFIIKLVFLLSMLFSSHAFAVNTAFSKNKEISEWDQRRVNAWHDLMARNQGGSTLDKLSRVNTFVNQIQYAEDAQQWGRKDYWATPAEFITGNAGDCEDYAITKYFTLINMGVPESQLRIAYVHSLILKQAHMVLYYYPGSGQQPLVLDNYDEQIKPAKNRADLLPVYSFNKKGLWLIKKNGSNQYVGSASRLSRWTEMLKRLPQNTFASL